MEIFTSLEVLHPSIRKKRESVIGGARFRYRIAFCSSWLSRQVYGAAHAHQEHGLSFHTLAIPVWKFPDILTGTDQMC